MTDKDKAPAPPPGMSSHTYFLYVWDDHEAKIAKAYIDKTYPNTAAKRVTDLRLDRLTDEHTVIVLRRGNERSPAVDHVISPQGQKIPKPIAPAELANEVLEAKPIRCSEFWTKGPDGEGELDLRALHERIGIAATPAAVKPLPGQGILRLGYA